MTDTKKHEKMATDNGHFADVCSSLSDSTFIIIMRVNVLEVGIPIAYIYAANHLGYLQAVENYNVTESKKRAGVSPSSAAVLDGRR